jgi:protein-disulfide isomerase
MLIMIRNVFSLLLVLIFSLLVMLYSYKSITKPEIKKVSLNEVTEYKKNDNNIEEAKNSYSQQQIESIVRDYIINHPEILVSSFEKMHKNKLKESSDKAKEYLENNRERIETLGFPLILGNNEGDISIVAFYDYNCTFCKKANIEINKIIANDPGVKVILRPIAILGDTSLYAAKISLALHEVAKDKLYLFHNDMMEMNVIDESGIKSLTEKYQLDYSIIKNEFDSHNVKQAISENYNLARSLGISGAPSYVINGVLVPGFLSEDQLKKIILQIRVSKDDKQKN